MKVRYLLWIPLCVGIIKPEDIEAEIKAARANTCYFIEHSCSGCTLVRSTGSKELKKCDHDACLAEHLKLNNRSSIFYFYDEKGKYLGYPFIFVKKKKNVKSYQKICNFARKTLNSQIKPHVGYVIAGATNEETNILLSFYDKNKQWVLDYPCARTMFSKLDKSFELTSDAKKRLLSSLGATVLIDATLLNKIRTNKGDCCLV